MKRIALTLVFFLTTIASQVWALRYEEARQEALFLTDKMAYELNLNAEQFDRAYQVNLDYLMSIDTPADCYGYYWTYRDRDLRCILFDWQYALYTTLDYFYRPIRRLRNAWYYPIFDHYRHGYFYFDRPRVYASYRGGMWRHRGHNTPSPYLGFVSRPGGGLRDRYHGGNGAPGFRPEYGRPSHSNASRYNGRDRQGDRGFQQGGHIGQQGNRGNQQGGRPNQQGDRNRNDQQWRNGGAGQSSAPGRGARPDGNYGSNGNHRQGNTDVSQRSDRPSRQNGGTYSRPGGGSRSSAGNQSHTTSRSTHSNAQRSGGRSFGR